MWVLKTYTIEDGLSHWDRGLLRCVLSEISSSRSFVTEGSRFIPPGVRIVKKGKTYNLVGKRSAAWDKILKAAQRKKKYKDAGKKIPKSRAKKRKPGDPMPYKPYVAIKKHDLRMDLNDILSFVRKEWRPRPGLYLWRGQVPKEERRGTFIRYYDAIKAQMVGGELPVWEPFHDYMIGLYHKLGRPKKEV